MNQAINTQAKTKAKANSEEEASPSLQLVEVPFQEFAKVKVNPQVLRQIALGYLANQHRSTANTKTRGEVSGGGRKPWRQKGTGRARTGSIRNPIWRGGGIIFGPSNRRNYHYVLPARLRRQALSSALVLKAKAGRLKTLKLAGPLTKTRDIKAQLPQIYSLRKVLLVIPDSRFKLAFKNLPNVVPMVSSRINALDILSFQNIVFVNDTYKEIRKRL